MSHEKKGSSANTAAHLITHIQKQLLKEIPEELTAHQYAWWLLEALTKQTKTDLLLSKKLCLNHEQEQLLAQWIHDITELHKPIAYILGDIPFGPLSIMVRPPVLIPRPETEEWALNLIDQIKQSSATTLNILDLCTGSGCIALLFAYMLPNTHVYAVDICSDALTLAEKNRKKLEINNLTIIKSDLFYQLPDIKYDLIISNPPYITADEYDQLEPSVQQWEHKHALYAQNEGLFVINNIINEAPTYINPNRALQEHGIKQLYIEIGWQQGDIVKKLMQKKGYTAITIEKDSAQKDRVVSGRIVNVATTTIEP